MRGVDLETYRFDFDLTFSVLFMHPDGTIYHRFGGRDHRSPVTWISMPPLIDLMKRSLIDHAAYSKAPRPPKPRKKRSIDDFPTWKKWVGERKIDCAHCHQVGEHEIGSAEMAGGFDRESIWRWPSPERIGLVVDPVEQDRVRQVIPASPAAASGLRPDDRLVNVGATAIGSINDIQAALEDASREPTELDVVYRRAGETKTAKLSLGKDWKRGDDRSFAWRALKWGMSPAPGFGGKDLTKAEKKRLELDPEAYAFRIGYLVTWGRNAHRGRNAARAGLRKGDVVYAVGGKTDFDSQQHFHAWFRLTAKKGEKIAIDYLRAGKQRQSLLTVVE